MQDPLGQRQQLGKCRWVDLKKHEALPAFDFLAPDYRAKR
jgi:hypothetical protein